MTTDLSKIRLSLNNCEEITLPYKFPPRCWIKYITLKGEDEAFYEGGIYGGIGDHKIFVVNKGKRLTAPTCFRADNGEIIYKSRFFIDPNKTAECEQDTHKDINELRKTITSQHKVIKRCAEQLKLLEDQLVEYKTNHIDMISQIEEKNIHIEELITKEKKYKLILSQFM